MTAAEYNRRVVEMKARPRWWADDALQAELADLAGGGCNECGVFEKPESERIGTVGKATATVHLAEMRCGLWVGSFTLNTTAGGSSSLPQLWGPAHDTRESCRREQLEGLLKAAGGHAKGTAVEKAKGLLPKLVTQIRAALDQTGSTPVATKANAKKAAKPAPKASTKPAPKKAPEVRAPAPAAKPEAAPRPPEIAGTVAVADVRPSPTNPRRTFDEATLRELADSIKSSGQLQDVLVRPVGANVKFEGGAWKNVDHYELVDGERRYRACVLGGIPRISVKVRAMTDDEVLLAQLAANDQREDVRPSEQAAAYKRLFDAGRSPDQIAADTGKPIGFVRGLLRLGRLPGWALAAVDAGSLPRATAELVARVPGEESRAKAAACVLLGIIDPRDLDDMFNDGDTRAEAAEAVGTGRHTGDDPLSYRDTKRLIQNHFTKELKGAPFSLKVLYQVPGETRQIQSCDACPKRAGNDPEALKEGTRADVCLDPDCYRAKVEAYRADEVAKAAKKGVELVTEELRWPFLADGGPPAGWLDPKAALKDCPDLYRECSIPAGEVYHASKPLAEHLGKLCPPQHLCFDPKGKPRRLLKAKEVRAALVDLGFIPKPAPKPKRQVDAAWLEEANKKPPSGYTQEEWDRVRAEKPAAPAEGKPLIAKVSEWEADERAAVLAANVLREYTADQCSALDEHEDAHEEGPIRGALELACRALCYDALMARDTPQHELVLKRFGLEAVTTERDKIDAAVCELKPSELIALLVEMGARMELQYGPNRATGQGLLAFAEPDWPALQEQARRELSGGENAEDNNRRLEAGNDELKRQIDELERTIRGLKQGT